MRNSIGVAFAGLLLAAAPAGAQERVTFVVNGVYDAAALTWSQPRTFTLFLEEASSTTRYEAEASAGFDVGAQFTLYRGIGLAVAFSKVQRDATGSLDARLPHPLYFDRDRSGSVDLSGFGYSEQVLHLGLGWQGHSGAVGFAVFGGVSLFDIKADATGELEFDQQFPFDDVSLRTPRSNELSAEPTGFHLGGRLDWRIASSIGLGAQLRYSAATASFSPAVGEPYEIDAGGLQLAAGIRLYF